VSGYRTKHYQLTRGSVGCYMSHLQLYQHILRETDAQFAFVFEDDAEIREPDLLAALLDAKPFPGALTSQVECAGCWIVGRSVAGSVAV
jgi:hypothetical protein